MNIQDPRCDTAKTFVCGSDLHLENFDECSAYMTKVITNKGLNKLEGGKKPRIAGLEKDERVTYKGTIENISYAPEVYRTFSRAQKKELRSLRLAGHSEVEKRKVAAAAVEQQQETSPAPAPITPSNTNTGGQFGSAGNKRKAADTSHNP